MADRMEQENWRQKLTAWVDGEREPKDQSLFVMEQRPHRAVRPSDEEHERREKHRLHRFFNWYPIAAGVLCLALVGIMMSAVLTMPIFGEEDNPTNNEVAQHYLEYGQEETGSANAVTAMILSYRGFDTLGESCVLFLAVTAVMILLLRDRNNTSEGDLARQAREDAIADVGALYFPGCRVCAAPWRRVPGGGFSGGTVLGAGLILFSSAFGHQSIRTFMDRRTYAAVRTCGLLLYALLYGAYIFIGANGLPNYLTGVTLLIDLAVGLVVTCTVYGFYALFSRGEL